MATDSDSVRLSQWPVFRQTSLSARVHRVTSNLLNIAQRRIIESEHSINIYDIAIYYRPTYHDRVNLYMYKLATSPPFAISRTRQRAERNFRISGYTINNRRTREFRCASSHAGHPRAFVCVQKKLCKL